MAADDVFAVGSEFRCGEKCGSEWALHAKCRGSDNPLFVEGASMRDARRLCAGCPVRCDCLAEALNHRVEYGVWGGLTERERRSILRRHRGVTDWRAMLCDGNAPGTLGSCGEPVRIGPTVIDDA